MIQPAIEIFGIQILEPVTTLTDLIVSFICYYSFIKLNKMNKSNKVILYFKYYFLSMGIATTIGGLIGHGFLYLFSFAWKLPGWITSMFSVALVERASIEHSKKLFKPIVGKVFKIVNIVELFTFITITLFTLNFHFVEIHSAYGLMFVVFSFHSYIYYKTKDKGSKIILIAVGITALSAIVYLSEFSIHKWFNYNDLSHILMSISAFTFYKGAINLNFEKQLSFEYI
ncbi:MAG: hypothetical protein PF487_08690 [Bacteroidales bacterium]|jgi:hypothetical protein|nr:hypothetical protein [Bacteroidales bacterium]